jgi:polyphosphate kinase 2 (PPK2 family)
LDIELLSAVPHLAWRNHPRWRRPTHVGAFILTSILEVSDMAKKKKRNHVQAPASPSGASREAGADPPPKLKRKDYEREMRRLHGELVAMQEWVKASGAKLCIVFEGRDTAGKGARSSGSPSG